MGNAAAKQHEGTTLGQQTAHRDGALCIDPELVVKGQELVKAKGNAYYKESGDENAPALLQFKAEGLMKNRCKILDGQDKRIATLVKKNGLRTDETYLFRDKPAYENQEAVTADEMKTMRLSSEDGDAKLYLFAKIVTKKGITTMTSTYSVATGKGDAFKTVYVAKKLSAMGFLALVTTPEELPVAKASMKGMPMNMECELGLGVDLPAVLVVVQSVVPGGNAGALAGAGVI